MKKLITSAIIILPLIILAIMLVSGALMSFVSHIYVESVEFSEKDALVLVMNDEENPPTYDLGSEINVLPIKAPNRGVKYKSDDDSLVRVDDNGMLTAVFYGETYVTVTSTENAAATAKRKIIVTDSAVHAVRFKEHEKEMYVGDAEQLLAQVFPQGVGPATVMYQSSDEGVLSVSPNGDVVCKGAGTVRITAYLEEDPSITDTVTISCRMPLASITTDIRSVTGSKFNMQFPDLKSMPQNATYSVEYASSDERVATVNKNGEVTFSQAGTVTVTATAKDGRGNSDSVSVVFTCTDGYYMGDLFKSGEYSFDYDEYAGKKALDIELQKSPAGSYRLIKSVTYDREGFIEFDNVHEKFSFLEVGEDVELGKVKITLTALKYSDDTSQIEELSEYCVVDITRKTSSIAFEKAGQSGVGGITINSSSVDISELADGGRNSVRVVVLPRNHRDKLQYSLSPESVGIAKLNGTTLEFSNEGQAVVTITSADGSVTADLTVTYVKKGATDRDITVNGDVTSLSVALNMSADGKETGLLNLTPPAGMKVICESDNRSVLTVDGLRLVPLKGGFANVTVKYVPESRAARSFEEYECEIKVYVDTDVSPADISFSVDNGYTTSSDTVEFTVTLNVQDGAMEGKTLWVGISGEEGEEKIVQDGVCTVVCEFPVGKDEMNLFASVKYAPSVADYPNSEGEKCEGVVCTAYRTVHTTRGNIISGLNVSYNGKAFTTDDANELIFKDINETLTLEASVETPDPVDFALTAEKISFGGSHGKFTSAITVEDGAATIKLSSVAGGEEIAVLKIAGKEYTINIKVELPAHSLEVKYGNTVLEQDQTYKTFLDELSLTVNFLRNDSETVSEKTLRYTVGGGIEETADLDGKTYSFTFSVVKETNIKINSALVEFNVNFVHCEPSDIDYVYHVEYSDNGRLVELDEFDITAERLEYSLPKTVTGIVSICIGFSGQIPLGGFDQTAMEYFGVTFGGTATSWTSQTIPETAKITVKIPSENKYFEGAEVLFKAGDGQVTLVFGCMEIGRVQFTDGAVSYDINKNEDVYPGYQQVRVFAKQSYYDGKVVDYFRLPAKAVKDDVSQESVGLDAIKWILTGYKESSPEGGVLVSQLGNTVTYKGEIYTIEKAAEGPSTLKKGAEKIAEGGKYVVADSAQRIPWVDVYAENEYAHIYFGNFGGLSESDVQNDYFGNFGEQQEWEKVEEEDVKDTSDRSFTPSVNAYKYLRIEAGDGAKDSSASAHFNFNVLEDSEVVNIFNAAGYVAATNKEIVLHNNLYGPNELGEGDATPADLTINSTDSGALGKTLIYGNGYQVNLQAKNKALCDELQDKENTGTGGITFGTLYNVTLKGTNPTDEVSCKTHKILMSMNGAYYSDLQYYSKMNPASTKMFLKNTVLRYVANAAVQLYQKAYELYFENVTIAECLRAVSIENNNGNKIYYKGFFDTLNYNNSAGLQSMFAQLNGGTSYSSYFSETGDPNLVTAAKEYLEWFGKDGNENGITNKRYYTNVIIIGTYSIMPASYERLYWNEETMTYSKLIDADKLYDTTIGINMGLVIGANVTIYNTKSDVDGGSTDYKFIRNDMNKLFTDKRDIRLLCQYLDMENGSLVKNIEHIQWHMNKVYRDQTLIGGEKNHIAALKQSIKNAMEKEEGAWDGKWADGSYIEIDSNGDCVPHDASALAMAMNQLLSHAVVPGKREFE